MTVKEIADKLADGYFFVAINDPNSDNMAHYKCIGLEWDIDVTGEEIWKPKVILIELCHAWTHYRSPEEVKAIDV